ncbi:hypothetical protein PI124_g9800 [Phytophthora idaei]|nr:hypothetical protein PI125_g8826 [Phytophthora idaei]KAG3157434.1 hypothetical protein PI126_g8336 [Phytophthora idaei]KAG3245472.1 hypothetical protein PI124_g9800 [Phytophthora idaei]
MIMKSVNSAESLTIRPSQIDTSIALSANTIDDVLRGALRGEEEEVAMMLANAAAEAANLIPDEVDVVLPLGLNTQDVVKNGEDTDEYESICSEADDSGWSDDNHVERRQISEDVSSDEEEVSLMDEAFIDCLGGSLSIENMDQNTLRTMAWTPASSDFDSDACAFPVMRDQAARPSADILAKKDSPS